MRIQPIANQPVFNGKVIFENGSVADITQFAPDAVWRKFRTISALVQDKPYDIFISKNNQDKNFYNVAANKSFKEAEKIKEYTVKVQSEILTESIVEAAKEAMDMYEKYIAKSFKG